MFFSLEKQRNRVTVQVFVQQFEEQILVLLPPEAVLGVADLKAFQMQFAEKSLVAVTVGLAENRLGPIPFIATALNHATTSEKSKARPGHISFFPKCREAPCSLAFTKIEVDLLAPQNRISGLRSI